MTIIAVRDGVMACDSGVTSGSNRFALGEKMRRLADGSILGVAGDWSSGCRLLDHMDKLVREKTEPDPDGLPPFGDVCGLWLRKSGVYLLECHPVGCIGRLKGKFFAEGSGYAVALGAMHAGATSGRAVDITCRVDTQCAPPIVVMEL